MRRPEVWKICKVSRIFAHVPISYSRSWWDMRMFLGHTNAACGMRWAQSPGGCFSRRAGSRQYPSLNLCKLARMLPNSKLSFQILWRDMMMRNGWARSFLSQVSSFSIKCNWSPTGVQLTSLTLITTKVMPSSMSAILLKLYDACEIILLCVYNYHVIFIYFRYYFTRLDTTSKLQRASCTEESSR